MRVGDEKDPDEADTVGAITLQEQSTSKLRRTTKSTLTSSAKTA